MAASGYTPIQIYHSTTASAAPTAGNLVNGELAINILDGKLYYKDNGGVVQVIATKGTGTIGGSTTQVQYNNTGALAGSANFTFDGTTATINTLNLTNALGAAYGGTAQSTYAQGDLLYASAANTLAKLPIGISTYILTSNGTIPGWSIPSSVVIGTATNLAGGAAGSVPYQSGASTTAFLSIGTVNQVITSTGSAPQWSSALTLTGLSNSGLTTLDKTVTVGNTSFNGAAVFAPATPAKVYLGTGTVTDVTSAIAATNAAGAIVALGITPIAATNANVTYTNASTLYIAGAPSAGTNITITNPYALYVAAGDAYFGASVSATTLDLTNLEVTNIKAKDGTASMTLADSTGVVTFSKATVIEATDNTNAALRITQLGTGNALLVEDSANPDSSPFVVTATGDVGIGTTSPAYKLDVAGSGASALFRINNATTGKAAMAFANNGTVAGAVALSGWWEGDSSTDLSLVAETGYGLRFYTNGSPTEKAVIDSSGNLGLGVTPSAWNSDYKSLNYGLAGLLYGRVGSQEVAFGTNWYRDSSSSFLYSANGFASYQAQVNGIHYWFTAPSGTANSAVVAASKSYTVVALGTTTLAEWQASFSGLSAIPTLGQVLTSLSSPVSPIPNGGLVTQNISFTQAMTLDASGNLLVGDTSNPGGRFYMKGGYARFSDGTYTGLFGKGSDLVVGGGASDLAVRSDAAILFSVGSAEKARITSGGDLGIGTSSPAVKLTVRSPHAVPTATTYTGGFLIHDEPNGIEPHLGAGVAYNGGDQLSWIQSNSSSGVQTLALNPAGGQVRFGNSAMLLDASGNLGIGVTSIGAIGSSKLVEIGATTGNSAFLLFNINNARTGAMYSNASETSVGSISATPLLLKTGDTEKARISSDGTFRVKGAGTAGTTDAVQFSGSAPASAMTLDSSGNFYVGTTSQVGGSNITFNQPNNADLKIAANVSTATRAVYQVFVNSVVTTVGTENSTGGSLASGTAAYATVLANNGAYPICFATNNTERARITSGGDFYVNTTAAGGKFYVVSDLTANNGLRVDVPASFTASAIALFSATAAGTGWYFLTGESSGGSARIQIRGDGDVFNANGTYGTISDARLKQDIVDAPSQWDDLKAVRFRKYRMKEDVAVDPNAPALLGVIAQELEAVCPGLVDENTNKNGEITKTVKSSILLMKAAVALQEAMARIEKLEAEVAALKGA